MTNRQPPRIALWLLERFVRDSEPLAGDLVEAFDGRPSTVWFWVQVLAAIAAAHRVPTTDIRPLQLVDLQPADAVERSRRLSVRFPPVSLNGSPSSGIGGLGLATLVALVTLVRPGAWWLLLASAAAGVVLGLVMIAVHAATPPADAGRRRAILLSL